METSGINIITLLGILILINWVLFPNFGIQASFTEESAWANTSITGDFNVTQLLDMSAETATEDPAFTLENSYITFNFTESNNITMNATARNGDEIYIEATSSEFPPTSEVPESPCGRGWLVYGNFCYWGSNKEETLDWAEARIRCLQIDSDLISFASFDEEQYIFQQFLRGETLQYWIGAHDIDKTGEFAWSDASPVTYTNWGHGEPSDNNNENCATLKFVTRRCFFWENVDWLLHRPWLCKRGIEPISDTNQSLCFGNHSDQLIFLQPETKYLIEAPNHPLFYPNKLPCTWLLETDVNQRIQLIVQDISIMCKLDILSFGNGHDPSNASSAILTRREPGTISTLEASESHQMWITWYQFCEPDLVNTETFFFNDTANISSVDSLMNSPFIEPYVQKNDMKFKIMITAVDIQDETDASNESCIAGWPIISRYGPDGAGWTMVSPDQKFLCYGEITQWRFQGKAGKPFRAIVWRPLDNSSTNTNFRIVGINEIPPGLLNFPNTYTVPATERIAVIPGDMIGWSFDGGVLTYNTGGEHRVRWLGGHLFSTLEVGQEHKINHGVGLRQYSIEATVGQTGESNLPTQSLIGRLTHMSQVNASPGFTYLIISPNYPSNYPVYIRYAWVITAPANMTIRLEIQDFWTEAGYDIVSIGNGNLCGIDPIWQRSGTTKLRVLFSRAEAMWVVFYSDFIYTDKGIAFYVKSVTHLEGGTSCVGYGFRCVIGGHCLDEANICDYNVDCPDGSDEEQCHQLEEPDDVEDEKCRSEYYYFMSDSVRCDPGWTKFRTTCYFLAHDVRVAYDEAQTDCSDRGAKLVTINDQEEQDFLTDQLIDNGKIWHGYYIGFDDIEEEGTFKWLDGTSTTYTAWSKDEPNDHNDAEDCASMRPQGNGLWNDVSCGDLDLDKLYAYICEMTGRIQLIGKPASQGSIYATATANKAVDGNINGVYSAGSCVHTTLNDPWWMVDLTASQCVGKVTIYNRVDCCQERIGGAEIRLGSDANRVKNPICGTITEDQAQAGIQKIEINCDLRGRYLSVELLVSQYLQICEVEASAGICEETNQITVDEEKCHLPLGLENGLLSDNSITSSSSNSTYQAYFARLRNESYWKPAADDIDPWVQMSFAKPVIISGVVIQGSGDDGGWVEEMKISYSPDDQEWHHFTNLADDTVVSYGEMMIGHTVVELHTGITNAKCPKVIQLTPAIEAQFIRIHPIASHDHPGMRLELLGCENNDCDYSLGMTSGYIMENQIASSSDNSQLHDYRSARVSFVIHEGSGWIPNVNDTDPWVEITLESVHRVTSIITQGCVNEDYWTTSYSLTYTQNVTSQEWMEYLPSDTNQSVFLGNVNRNGLVKNKLVPPILALKIRILPVTWYENICLRFELTGCASEYAECSIGHSACNTLHHCTASKALIASSNYPSYNYFPIETCTWRLVTSEGTFISVSFIAFDLLSWDECVSSSIDFYDGLTDNYDLLGSFCNKRKPPDKLLSSFNEMFIRFESGREEPGTGFLLQYSEEVLTAVGSSEEYISDLADSCPDGWEFWKDRCYKFFRHDTPLRWTAAEEICILEYGGHLVSIRDKEDMNFVHSFIISHGPSRASKIHIGLRFFHRESDYRWTDGRPVSYTDWKTPRSFDEWALRQPDGGRLEGCTVIEINSVHFTNNWQDVPCASDEATQYVCFKDLDIKFNMDKTNSSLKTEVDMKALQCPSNLFTCASSQECIQLIYKCDGRIDCPDASDEDDCRQDVNVTKHTLDVGYTCLPGRFRCGSGECISISYVCDFIQHCQDNSDEKQCIHRECRADEYRCAIGQCIGRHLRCDLQPDCIDESDERNCVETKNGFQCYDGTWLPANRYCDGQRDCAGKNWEDEPIECSYEICKSNELQCNNGDCVDSEEECLYGAGCRDATHLRNCEHFSCNNGTLKCPSSYCIQLHHRCDGVMNCPNGEDERYCETFECPGAYKCREHRQCLQLSQVCDGIKQCRQGDDEFFCDNPCPDGCICDGLYLTCQAIDAEESLVDKIASSVREIHFIDLKVEFEETRIGSVLLRKLQLFSSLIVLEVSGVSISTILPGGFHRQRNLRQLSLARNNIHVLQNATFFGLISLQLLDLSDNPITDIHEAAFKSLANLLYLNIQRTSIYRPDPGVYQELKKLQTLYSDKYSFCCVVQDLGSVTECLPKPDQFSSCQDLMRSQMLRILMWIFGLSALLGNGFVIMWRLVPRDGHERRKSKSAQVQSFLVLNLALGDGLMGVYMLIIASADMYYRGVYIVHAEEWQGSFVCKLAGLLSVLSSETSVFFMTIISVDRFLSIVLPFSQINLSPKTAKIAAAIIWFITIVLSLMPLFVRQYFGDEYYGRSSVCLALPLTTERPDGWQYSVALFLFVNLIAFTIIMVCYLGIFIIVKLSSRKTTNTRNTSVTQQLEFAMRMGFLVATDFMCWMPIIAMGFLSLTKTASIPAIVYVWSAVVILPINSALNPFLFTILTREMSKQKARKLTKKHSQYSSNGTMSLMMHSNTTPFSDRAEADKLNTKRETIRVCDKSPTIRNLVFLSDALHNNKVTFSKKDMDLMRRDLDQQLRYYVNTSLSQALTSITAEEIVIDKALDGPVKTAFINLSDRIADDMSNEYKQNTDVGDGQTQTMLNGILDKLRDKINVDESL